MKKETFAAELCANSSGLQLAERTKQRNVPLGVGHRAPEIDSVIPPWSKCTGSCACLQLDPNIIDFSRGAAAVDISLGKEDAR